MIDLTLQQLLEEPEKFCYKQDWMHVNATGAEINDILILEIFTFGTIEDIKDVELQFSDLMLIKLIKLSIIKLSESYRNITYDEIKTKINNTLLPDYVLEQYLISLLPFLECKIDAVNREVNFIKCKDSRDVYDFEYPLHVIPVDRVVTRQQLIQKLGMWRDNILNNSLVTDN